MVHKKLSVSLLTLGSVRGVLASANCLEPASSVVRAVNQLDLAIASVASLNEPKSWMQNHQSALDLSDDHHDPLIKQLQELSSPLVGQELTQCDIQALVPTIQEFSDSLVAYVTSLKSDDDFSEFTSLQSALSQFEPTLFTHSYDCDS